MAELVFLVLLLLNGAHWISICVKPQRLLEFPSLISIAVSGFVLPQAAYLLSHDWMLGSSFALFLLLVLFSQLFTSLGWFVGLHRRGLRRNSASLQINIKAMLFSIFAVGLFFTVWLRTLPPALLMQSQWSGLPVVLNFFASANVYSFVLALALYLRTNRGVFFWVAAIAAIPLADRVFIQFRREDVMTVSLAIFLVVYIYKRWTPPRAALLLALIFGVALFNSAGEYRSATFQYAESGRTVSFDNFFERIFSLGGIEKFLGSEETTFSVYVAPEAMNAVQEIEELRNSNKRLLGASIFNKVIQDFVPSSIFGFKIDKPSLFFANGAGVNSLSNLDRLTGSTSTGYSDIYANFDVFGVFVFFLLSLVMSVFFRSAMSGSALGVMWYVAAAVEGMKVVTHGMGNFVSELIYLAVLTAPFLFLLTSKGTHPRGAFENRRKVLN